MDNIILASSSPRRRKLLKKFKVEHTVVESHTKEITNEKDNPAQTAMGLAFRKAYDVGKRYRDSIVIGADTIVVFENQILGKPKDKLDAEKMLEALSGNEHEVITGIGLINLHQNKKIVDFERTIVKFEKLDKELIARYINTKEPFDKAGSYGIQGYGSLLVKKINGCYDNVIGLPMSKLNKLLYKHFDIKLL